jgi:ribosomal-protein-alanine N-acetyltransferase
VSPTTAALRVHLRWLVRDDMADALAIERASFAAPWGEEAILGRLRRVNSIAMVALAEGRVVAYMLYELHPRSLRLLRLAAFPGWRRLGVGRQMVARLLGKLAPSGRRRLVADVPEEWLEAQLWLKACGLRATAILKGGRRGNLYRMEARP